MITSPLAAAAAAMVGTLQYNGTSRNEEKCLK
jgi:hypothetical protein